ncbi:DUF2264 domain-containing protein [Jiangella asiatica]|uniref:DUF2264 domain-containing protein n=1 Tax=Jiangella asiatica TaxID=2530372 RepID=A0A4R5DH47_9ACTN|nr:DUF2264 domain-containing protein [Jiangella asiatica]
MRTPLNENPFDSRADLQRAVHDLWVPVARRLSPGGARARLGYTAAQFSNVAAELEGFARPLWGLAPLAAGGGEVDWAPIRAGLASGTDPGHPEFWRPPADRDQRLVEMAAIGFALALVPDQLWAPLPAPVKDNVARWLSSINRVDVVDNNWLFFRVIVNLGLERVGAAEYDEGAESAALDRLETFYLYDGWYQDGPTGRCDYYVPWAMHFYGLVYAEQAGHRDPGRALRFRQRAAEFAHEHLHWFADDGAAVPYGRSLAYRFAQLGFWGALAYGGVEELPWGVVKGVLLRGMRWWARRPITDNGDVLTIGYGYPNLMMADGYNSPGSPYWAMKAFLPLALPESHPFWQADEAPMPDLDDVASQPAPGMVHCRDRSGGHVFTLAAGQPGSRFRHGGEKYAKFAYSTAFGFSVPASERGLEHRAADSMLALSDDDLHWRVRVDPDETRVHDDVVWARWRPWSDVDVDTWLVPWLPWHVRVHRLRTARTLWSAEGGWAVGRDDDEPAELLSGPDAAVASCATGVSGLRDLLSARDGEVVLTGPNTNLLHPRAALPTLRGSHGPGEHWLVCAVLGSANPGSWEASWTRSPTLDAIRQALAAEVVLPQAVTA